jgi:hypothetical protein
MAYIAGTVFQRDFVLFVLPEMVNDVAVYKSQIFQVQYQRETPSFRTDRRIQLGQVLAAHPADEREDDLPFGFSSDSKHDAITKAKQSPSETAQNKKVKRLASGEDSAFGEKSPPSSALTREDEWRRSTQSAGRPRKRFLSIFSERILDSRVERGTPSLAAAPSEPATRPRHSFNADSIIFF